MLKKVMTYLLPFILFGCFFDVRVFPWVLPLCSILILGLFICCLFSGIKKKGKIFSWSKIDFIFMVFLMVGCWTTFSLSPITFPLALFRFSQILAAYFLYKTAGGLDREELFRVLMLIGTAISVVGILKFGFLKNQGLVVAAALYAQLGIVLGLSRWLRRDSLADSLKYFPLLFTNFYYLFLTSSRLIGAMVLPGMILYLVLASREQRSTVFMRLLASSGLAAVAAVFFSLFGGSLPLYRIGVYCVGLTLSFLLVKFFYPVLKKERVRYQLFWLSIFLCFLLVSSFSTFLVVGSRLELFADLTNPFALTMLNNPLSMLGEGYGLVSLGGSTLISILAQGGLFGLVFFLLIVVVWITAIVQSFLDSRGGNKQILLASALTLVLTFLVPIIFVDLTGKFALIYLAAVYFGSLQAVVFPNSGTKEGKVRLKGLISGRLILLLTGICLIVVQSTHLLGMRYAVLGRKYLHLGDGLQARGYLKKALKINPYHGEYYYQLALASDLIGEDREAVSYIEQALNLEPSDRTIQVLAGNLYLKQGQFEQAEQCYLKVGQESQFILGKYENLAAAYLAKAQELIKGGKQNQAEDYLQKIQIIHRRMSELIERGEFGSSLELSSRMKLIISKSYYYLRDYGESEKWARRAMQHSDTRSSAIEIIYFIHDQKKAGNL